MPTNIAELRLGGASEAELATLQRLADELSADYTVFYSRHVADLTPRRQAFGEIDFVIVNQSGDVVLIEQKNGSLQEAEDDLGIRYAGQAAVG
ncbi:nuclease-related domain-containing protein [Spiribacter insolitus]|uniref:Nuclease-related domain-containing protein n=1 Tax=Spiribacter insolitus TaxID=3122417 RepID=A0ABV3T5A0_9GAMM